MDDATFEMILAETKRKFEESFADVFKREDEEQDFFKLDGVENENS